jgi:hypothetical protein
MYCYVDAKEVITCTNYSISIVTVQSSHFGILYTFLALLHKTTYFVIFFFTCIINWKSATFVVCILLNAVEKMKKGTTRYILWPLFPPSAFSDARTE